MTINFGKHAGKDITEVPEEYIIWLLNSRKQDVAVYEAELERRRQVEIAEMSVAEQIVARGFRELAKAAHPDHGGSTAQFQALQAGKAQLEMLLKELKAVKGTL